MISTLPAPLNTNDFHENYIASIRLLVSQPKFDRRPKTKTIAL
jgi:hypothetical protein